MAEELVFIPGRWDITYNYAAGKVSSKFFAELRDNKRLMGIKCSRCGRVMMPPRGFCERCFAPAGEWVEVGPEGTIQAFTITVEKFEGNPDPPFAVAYVQLDGADTAMLNYVRGLDFSDLNRAAESLRVGTRVRVVYKEQRAGEVTDFEYELV
ncbi:MAG TPA: Zn-ribbon domain-containing OB-fold protein [Dehalococcoidia bacterium]|jgi:hypothetical protein|nr:Zn-ribbon domain-containing OB-fold protein [Dehalococcoidia bacterium]